MMDLLFVVPFSSRSHSIKRIGVPLLEQPISQPWSRRILPGADCAEEGDADLGVGMAPNRLLRSGNLRKRLAATFETGMMSVPAFALHGNLDFHAAFPATVAVASLGGPHLGLFRKGFFLGNCAGHG
jgi:hypothetical protein